jgi:2-phosphosulfolactate phosphatase
VRVEVGVSGARAARDRGGVVVLVDALRASATVVTALARGIAAVRPVATVEECVGEVTAGERGGRKLPHLDHSNSPTELLRSDHRGRTLTLTTTNGTRCLDAAAGSRSIVLVATTLNAAAAARAALRLAREHDAPVTLLLAGRDDRSALEDELAAGVIARAMGSEARLQSGPLPASADLEASFLGAPSGRELVALGCLDDVRFCAEVDRFDVVPILGSGVLTSLD